jgi:hypothetical protein
MGTTGHPVGYYEVDTTERLRGWLERQYTWSEWRVIDLGRGTKRPSNWWLALEKVETGKVMAVQVIVNNRSKRAGMLYTKEVSEDMGPYATDIPKRIFSKLTPLAPEDGEHAREWRNRVSGGLVRG